MSKRKRSEKDRSEGEERHAKIRVQEVKKSIPSTGETRESEPTEPPATVTPHSKDVEEEEAIRKAARKSAKQERRALERANRNTNNALAKAPTTSNGTDLKAIATEENYVEVHAKRPAVKGKAKRSKKERKTGAKAGDIRENREPLTFRSKWTRSDPIGGRMLDLDPIFTQDEQHLMVAYGTFVAVYSTSSSTLVRKLHIKITGIITGMVLDISRPDTVFVSTSSREIGEWKWETGQLVNRWHAPLQIHALSATDHKLNGEAKNTVYTIDKKSTSQWLLSALRLVGDEERPRVESLPLLNFGDHLTGLQVFQDGKVIVSTSGHKLIIGVSDSSVAADAGEIKYLWRIVDCPEWITTFDVRIRPSDRTNKKHLSKGGLVEAIDIAVGGLKGAIHVYEDLVQKLVLKERTGKAISLDGIASLKLHWHRNAVMTVKWSLDGNYIISGGLETVLILWQLETGKKQHLPHLGAPIESIVVSPKGSAYSVRLADNSAMILSTSELRPTFSIAGVQLPSMIRPHNAFPHLPSVDMPFKPTARPNRAQYPACVTLSGTDRLSLAVPPSSISNSSSSAFLNASYLQTCDISSGYQISRQALTRTKITTLNMGPELNTIEEPNVTHMQISCDGQWLATIDEWTPPRQDIAPLAFDEEAVELEQIARQEIYLKFWSWNIDQQTWELVSRIDNPQAVDFETPYESNRVLELVSNPKIASFSSIGADGSVKIWVPAVRMRRELKVKGKDGKPLISWRCQHQVSTAMSGAAPTGNQKAKLAYSPDGSLLAAVPFASSLTSSVYLIDTSTSYIQTVQYGISSGPILNIGIISKYLIVLSHHLMSWDLVNNELHYDIDLHIPNLPLDILNTSLLAVDHAHEIFAVTLPEKPKSANFTTKLAIMDSSHPEPLFLNKNLAPVTNLLPAKSKKGFYAIDTNAEIRTFAPQTHIPPVLLSQPSETAMTPTGINGIFGPSQTPDTPDKKLNGLLDFSTDTISAVNGRFRSRDHDTVVVSADKLAQVFETGNSSAFSMPPVMELFERVAGLYDGRVD